MRTSRLRVGKKKLQQKNKKTQREWAKKKDRVPFQCPVFQAHPKLILHLVSFEHFPSSSTSVSVAAICPPSHHQPRSMVTLMLSGDGLMSSFSTKVLVDHVRALWKLRHPIINNIFWPGEPLFGAELHFADAGIAAPSFHVWMLRESLSSFSGLQHCILVRTWSTWNHNPLRDGKKSLLLQLGGEQNGKLTRIYSNNCRNSSE